MSDVSSPSPSVLHHATPAAKPGESGGVNGFARDFLRGSAIAFGIVFIVMSALYLWDYHKGRALAGELRDLRFFLVCFSVVAAANALVAAAGAGAKRCVLGCNVSSMRWIGIAGGVVSLAVIFGAMWASHNHEGTAFGAAIAAPVIAGFLIVRRRS